MKRFRTIFVFIFVISFSCLICHGEYRYEQSSGFSCIVPSGWTLNTTTDTETMTNSNGDVIKFFIADLNTNTDNIISENKFIDLLDLFSIDTKPTSSHFSSYPFYYAEQNVETKKSLQDLINELSYDEFVTMFGEHFTSYSEYLNMKLKFLGVPGTKNNPYYYFDSVKACALYKSTIGGVMFMFYYDGTIDGLASFEYFLNSIHLPVKKPAVATYLGSTEDSNSTYTTAASDTSNTSYETNSSLQHHNTEASSLLEKFVIGAVSASVFLVTPQLWNYGKKSKNQSVASGKIYYGVLYYRLILLFLAAFMSAEMVLLPIVGDSLENTPALVLALLFSIPIAFLYVRLYKKYFSKKHLTKNNSDIEEG